MKIPKYRWLLLFAVVTLLCCDAVDGATVTTPATPPAGTSPVTPVTPPTDAGLLPDGAAADAARSSSVDRPTDIPRPPTGRLPPDLIPPGMTL